MQRRRGIQRPQERCERRKFFLGQIQRHVPRKLADPQIRCLRVAHPRSEKARRRRRGERETPLDDAPGITGARRRPPGQRRRVGLQGVVLESQAQRVDELRIRFRRTAEHREQQRRPPRLRMASEGFRHEPPRVTRCRAAAGRWRILSGDQVETLLPILEPSIAGDQHPERRVRHGTIRTPERTEEQRIIDLT